jgi:hypothetical protein
MTIAPAAFVNEKPDADQSEVVIKFISSSDAMNFFKAITDEFYWGNKIPDVKENEEAAEIVLKVSDYNSLMNSELFIDLPDQVVELSTNLKPS